MSMQQAGPRSLRLEPGLGLVEGPEVAAHLQPAVLGPEFRLVDLAVLRIHDRAALVAVSAPPDVADDDAPDDRLVLVGAGALGAHLRLAVLVGGLGETDDLPEELAVLLVELHLGDDLAALVVHGVP